MNKMDRLLKRDVVADAEKIVGKSWKESELVGFLSLAMVGEHSKEKKDALLANQDSWFGMPLADYLDVIHQEGFRQVLALPFVGEPRDKDDLLPQETFFMLFHSDGILLAFDTYHGNLNGGHFYYNWKPNNINTTHDFTSSGGFTKDLAAWIGDHDCREAIRYHIKQLRENGQFLNPWIKQPFLWLLHYMDTKDENYDYKAIVAERIAMLPANVRAVICTENEQLEKVE